MDKPAVEHRIVRPDLALFQCKKCKLLHLIAVRPVRLRVLPAMAHNTCVHERLSAVGERIVVREIFPDRERKKSAEALRNRLDIVFIQPDNAQVLLHSLRVPAEIPSVSRLSLHRKAHDRLEDAVHREAFIGHGENTVYIFRIRAQVLRQVRCPEGKLPRHEISSRGKYKDLLHERREARKARIVLPKEPEHLRVQHRAARAVLKQSIRHSKEAPAVPCEILIGQHAELHADIALLPS